MRKRLCWLLILLRDVLFLPIGLLLPRNKYKIVCGAWFGRQFTCSPKYFARYMGRQSGYRTIWIGEEALRPLLKDEMGVEFVRMGTLVALWHQITAKYYVYNINWEHDIGRFTTYGRVVLLNTWHGIPNKMVGNHQKTGGVEPELVQQNLFSRFRAYVHSLVVGFSEYCYSQKSYLGSASPWMSRILSESFPARHSLDRMINVGMPRNDILVQECNNSALKQSLKNRIGAILGVPPGLRWYLYMPTWRHADGVPFSFITGKRKEEYQAVLGKQGAILIEKQHPKTLRQMNLSGGIIGNICIVSEAQGRMIDVQELLLCADRLISDYSSCIIDYSHLRRPIINYTYDYDFFNDVDSGLEYDLRDYATGPFVYNEAELVEVLAQDDGKLLEQRKESCEEHIAYEHGCACKGFFNLIRKLNGEEFSE